MIRTLARASLFALLASSIACGGSSPAAPPASADHAASAPFDASTADAFTASTVRLLHEAVPQGTFTVVAPLQIAAKAPAGDDLRISLERIWGGCEQDRARCETIARDYVAKSATVLTRKEAPATRENVVAAVRPRTYLDALPPQFKANALSEPLAGDLVVFYMVDFPESARGLTPDDLAKLGVARADLPALARHNLDARLGSIESTLAGAAPGGITMVQTGSYYEASRMLQREQWASLAARIKKPIVVAVPSTELMMVLVDPSPEMLARLRDGVRAVQAKLDRPLSSSFFRWTDQGWVVAE